MNLFSKLWADDAGVVTLEYLVLGTFLGLSLIVGVVALAGAINAELVELGEAILSFNQSFATSGFSTCGASTTGSQGADTNGGISAQRTAATSNPIAQDFCN